jgi:hypothetical protein
MPDCFHRTLRLVMVLLLCSIATGVFAQADDEEEYRYSFRIFKKTYEDAIKVVNSRTGYQFLYSPDLLPKDRQLTFSFYDRSIREILAVLFKDTGLSFRVDGQQAIIYPLKAERGVEKYTFTGTVTDAQTGESIIGTTVYLQSENTGVATDITGYYAFQLPRGRYYVSYSSAGYTTQLQTIDLRKDSVLNIELEEDEVQLNEVVVRASRYNPSEVQNASFASVRIPATLFRQNPPFLGEPDPVKTLQLLPGVQAATTGSTGLLVRGGGPDQNLVLMDETPLYNSSHFFGLFSVFNPDMVKEAELHTGGIPAQYGGRLSSVLEVHLREGNRKEATFSGGIGSIASRLMWQQPFADGKGVLVAAARRTYTDLLLRTFADPSLSINALAFNDINLRLRWQNADNSRWILSAYRGRDQLGFDKALTDSWGNELLSLQYQTLLKKQILFSVNAYTSSFSSKRRLEFVPAFAYDTRYRLRDYGLKATINWFILPELELEAGTEHIYHTYNIGQIVPLADSTAINPTDPDALFAAEQAGFFQVTHQPHRRWELRYGLRYSIFSNIGPAEEYQFNTTEVLSPGVDIENVTDTLLYGRGNVYHTMHGPEPRLHVLYKLSPNTSAKFTYSLMRQYVHQLAQVNSPSQADVWFPATRYLSPQIAHQFTLGARQALWRGLLTFSAEAYYKKMRNQLEFRPSSPLIINNHLELDVLAGDGTAYGLETHLQKIGGRHNGWLSYTHAYSYRQVNGINSNKRYPTSWDQRHNFSLVYNYQPTNRFTFTANFIYASGVAYTFPVGRYRIGNNLLPYYTSRNGFRLPPTHRLDVSATFYRRQREDQKNESSFNFSVYNVYSRKNTFAYLFRQNELNAGATEVANLYLFGLLPSFTYNFAF